MARFLYFILIAILVQYLWRVLAERVAKELRRMRDSRERTSAEEGGPAGARALYRGMMVRDAVCGLHVPEGRAVTERRSGELFYFCSERCRKSFLASEASRARA